jgi:hypothetical protein
MKFDPFNNRLSRDIRNQLSGSFMSALRTKNLQKVQTLAAQYSGKGFEPYHQEYIEKHLGRYEKVLKRVKELSFDDKYILALHLWDEELFYEVHEYLEYHWKRAAGEDKRILQAMIRAAGTYIHLEHGNLIGAEKMAAKAVKILEASRGLLPFCLDLDLLLLKLRNLDPVPPKLGCRS